MSVAEQKGRVAAAAAASDQAGPSTVTRNSSHVRQPVSRSQTGTTISLIDRTSLHNTGGQEEEQDDDQVIAVDEQQKGLDPSSPSELSRKWTRQSLQMSLAHRKYAKYQEDRLFRPQEDVESEDDQTRMQWGKKKVKGLLKTKRQFQLAQKEDAAIDVLWENQRGWWAFGVPHFSSKSLLNFDPKPWLNGHRKPSPVDITNAQVPDPDWEWAWKSWYVDMSRDVDEEGWEHSFAFSRGFAWHGNHPWGHSWVRRRRWLRKRVRKHTQHSLDERQAGKRTIEAHQLNADYFTIHPSNNLSRTNSLVPSTIMKALKSRTDEIYVDDPAEIRNIGSLLAHLKKAALDREKIVLVRYFVDNAGEDVYYLEEQMPVIMAQCIFQNSRRQLLSMLMEKCDAASRHRDSHKKRGEAEGPQEKRRIDNLVRAIKAADDQVKKLEYWSDQRTLVNEGKAGTAPDGDEGWNHDWQGLDNSGPSANDESTAKQKGKSNHDVIHEETHEQIYLASNSHGMDLKGDEAARQEEENDSTTDAKYETAEEEQKPPDAEAGLDRRKDGLEALHEHPDEEDPRLVN